MQENRQSNYDLLRCLAMLGVIISHVCLRFINAEDQWNRFIAYIWRGIGFFAVSSFFMLTGAFSINRNNTNFGDFYKKSFNKTGIHVIIFSCFYLFESFIRYKFDHGYGTIDSIKRIAHSQLIGWGDNNHLWYVYTLAGIYFCIPIVSTIREKYVNSMYYHIGALLYCIWGFLCLYFDGSQFAWGIPTVFGYFAFVILGSEIKYYYENRRGGGGKYTGNYLFNIRILNVYC